MSARIAGFVTRAQAGLVGPKSVSRSITPQHGGVAVHYGGPRQPAAEPGADHALCVRTWKNWQRFHMGTRGWSDIAYTGGFCQHGYAFAGRGAGVRTAANGTNTGNQNYYAVTFIGGEGQALTAAAIEALEWWIHTLRTQGANTKVKSHRFFKPTGCPGDPLVGQAARLDGQHVHVGEAPAPTPPPQPRPPAPAPPKPPAPSVPPYPGLTREGMRNSPVTRAYQARLKARGWRIAVDGDHGPGTSRILRAFQQEKRLGVDGMGGPATWRALWTAPR